MKNKLLVSIMIVVLLMLSSCSFVTMPVDEKATDIGTKQEKEMIPESEEDISLIQKHVSAITVDDGCKLHDSAYLKGTEYEYVVYEVRSDTASETDYEDFGEKIYWQVVVLKNNEVITILRQEYDEFSTLLPSVKHLVYEVDVNFDGKNDILLHLGNFGAQGAIWYTGYLNKGDGFEKCLSLPNGTLALNAVSHTVSTINRDSAAEHTVTYYSYTEDGEFVPFEYLSFMPHERAYSYYDNAAEYLGEDESVYEGAEYRCVVTNIYKDGEWEFYRIYPHEEDSPYFEHKHVCYYKDYKDVHSMGTEMYDYKVFNPIGNY